MSEVFSNPEQKFPPQALLHSVLTKVYDRGVEELIAHSGLVRMREFDYADEPEKLKAYEANFKGRFQPIKMCTDGELVERMWALGDEYVDLALIDNKIGPIWPTPELQDTTPYTLLHPVREASAVRSVIRIENKSTPIALSNFGSRIESAPNGGDFMGVTIQMADDSLSFAPTFVYDEPPMSNEGTIYTSPEMPPFFVPYWDRISLMRLVGEEQRNNYSEPYAYLRAMEEANLPITKLSDDECLAIIDVLQKGHAITIN